MYVPAGTPHATPDPALRSGRAAVPAAAAAPPDRRLAARGSSRTFRAAAILAACVALLLALAAGSAAYDAAASAAAQAAYPPPGQFATLASGRRLHYVCAGQGEPALVLLAGFGGDVLDWSPVLPALSRARRVCAFDRLGQGWSDPAAPAAAGATFGTAADELHEAVRAAGIQRPIVVGHSLGGALAQVYAAEHDVAGLVLVDGLTSGAAEAVLTRLGTYQSLAPLGRVGLLRPIAGIMVDPVYPAELREQMFALRARSSALGAVAQEGAIAARSALQELRGAEATLASGRVPVLVIGAGATDVPQLPKGAFVEAQRAFAERTPGAEFALVPDARHYVMAERPEVVAGLVETWAAARVDRGAD
jgi:pimeloyl-ACP methyl ester carboxylesterase